MPSSTTSSVSSTPPSPSNPSARLATSMTLPSRAPLLTGLSSSQVIGDGNDVQQQVNGTGQAQQAAKAKSGELKDFLDLADGLITAYVENQRKQSTRFSAGSDINSFLEQKRLEHERQRELQKAAFEQQMKLLALQQEAEERELLSRASSGTPSQRLSSSTTLPSNPVPGGGPTRSRSGNDLVAFGSLPPNAAGGGTEEERKVAAVAAAAAQQQQQQRKDYASAARSMPASRRHSGENQLDGAAIAAGHYSAQQAGYGGAGGYGQQQQQNGRFASQGAGGARGQQQQPSSFLFDDELDADLNNSAWGGKYLQMNTDDDKFPILVRRDSYPGVLSASSAALDLAPLSQLVANRNGPGGPGGLGAGGYKGGAPSEWPQFPRTDHVTPTAAAQAGDRIRSVSHTGLARDGDASAAAAAGAAAGSKTGTPAPAAGSDPVTANGSNGPSPSGSVQPQQQQRQPASGRASPATEKKDYVDGLTDQFSNFNLDTAAFNPEHGVKSPFAAYGGQHDHGFGYDSTYGGLPKPRGGNGGPGGYPGGLPSPSLARPAETNRFAGLRLEDLQGDMLPLCKDQFGCRYLQKKLEDGNPEHRDMIFNEIFPHFAELMTDPFANYLSQRLLEYCTDEQRDALIEAISGELVSISLNMHGTRAVQKMIDFLSTKRQIQSLILALNLNVVTLIKDLNGNHVIQKCLNHLPPEDNQFIYNAVATHCIEVATHRHGCCVLQRCIDHASESQRIQLVTEITYNSLTLVQDAFGNYVVQYVLDLNDNRFIEAIVRQFLGNVSALSAQKFSSNVVEKSIRVADAGGRRALIDELLQKNRLERLIRDSFANYVVQTAIDYAEPAQRTQLIEMIRPLLPMIRNTPYGKRIQSKIQRETGDHMGGRGGGGYGGHHGGQGNHMMHGNYYGMQMHQHPGHHAPPPGYMPHHMSGQMGQMGPNDFGARGPPFIHNQHMGGPPQLQHLQSNGSMSSAHQQQFAAFPPSAMGIPPAGMGYAPFM